MHDVLAGASADTMLVMTEPFPHHGLNQLNTTVCVGEDGWEDEERRDRE